MTIIDYIAILVGALGALFALSQIVGLFNGVGANILTFLVGTALLLWPLARFGVLG